LINPQALQQLSNAAANVPSGAQIVDGLLGAARTSLAGAIQQGFFFVLLASMLAIAAACMLQNLRFESRSTADPAPEATTAGGYASAVTIATSMASMEDGDAYAQTAADRHVAREREMQAESRR
jgi:hypothetical protein